MSVAHTYSAVLLGVQAHVVEVEAHLSSGLPGLSIVGLPDTAMNEARDRVRAAVVNSGLRWPAHRITVGLSPAWLPKRGSGLDVAIALAILAADGQLDPARVAAMMALGELSLDGRVRSVAGSVAAALALVNSGVAEELIVTPADASVLQHLDGVATRSASTLAGLVADLTGKSVVETESDLPTAPVDLGLATHDEGDFADVRGHSFAKLGLEVAAVGGHHVLLIGRAGVGKTLLAERLPSICPDLDMSSSLEVTAAHQVAQARSGAPTRLITRPPFVAPHHTASRVAIVGGGSEDKPTVGAVTRAHRGFLFLDEAAEFEPSALDSLREPIESGSVRITRAGFHLSFPAQFQLIMATNPCPCGNAMDTAAPAHCVCSPSQRRRYLARLSGPLLDRIDVRLQVHRPSSADMAATGEASAIIRRRVVRAREVLHDRLAGSGAHSVCAVTSDLLATQWRLDDAVARRLRHVGARESLRGLDRITRLAWSVAALAGRDVVVGGDVDVAMELRGSPWQAAA